PSLGRKGVPRAGPVLVPGQGSKRTGCEGESEEGTPFLPREGGWGLGRRQRAAAGEAPEEVAELAILPDHEEHAGVKDRAVGAADDADQEGEDEVVDRPAAEEEQRQQREHDRERGIERACERLIDAVVDDVLEALECSPSQVLPDAVEDDDR